MPQREQTDPVANAGGDHRGSIEAPIVHSGWVALNTKKWDDTGEAVGKTRSASDASAR